MTPQQIATNWIAEKGYIKPVNPYPKHITGANYSHFERLAKQHTYPCPTLADGEYDGKDLFMGYDVDGERIEISLKQQPAIDAGETVGDVMNDWFSKQDAVVDPEVAYMAGHTHATNDANLVPLDKVVEVLEGIKDVWSISAPINDIVTHELNKAITQIKNLTKE